MKVRRILAALAVSAALAGGTALAAGGAAQAATPNGITATEAYSDSVGNMTAVFGSLATPITSPDTQVPVGDKIQFGATSSRGFPVLWSTSPATFISSTGLTVALPAVGVVPFTAKVLANDFGPGVSQAVATITISQGDDSSHDSVTIVFDTVVLNAPTNADGGVTFSTVPASVHETAVNLPAGVVFDGTAQTLSVGTAVQGHYPLFTVKATDSSGEATATEGVIAVVGPFFEGVPVLSGGRATEGVNPSRENVSFIQSNVASCDHFTIVGPGAINGHQGWVPGVVGLNVAVYGGLEQHHGYTVYYQPVSGPADCSTHSTTPWPGSHWGYVFFVTA